MTEELDFDENRLGVRMEAISDILGLEMRWRVFGAVFRRDSNSNKY